MDSINLNLSSEDRLFGAGEGKWQEVTVQAGTTSNVVPYSTGFRDAGDMLVRQGIETQMQDFIAFPALYCYRHALELAMKDVVYEWERAENGDFEVLGTHDLKPIWDRARATLELAWPEGDTGQLDRMEAIIGELALADPTGEQFRYDRDRKGFVRDLPEELRRFDLRNASRVMNKLITLMWGALDGIAEMRDAAE